MKKELFIDFPNIDVAVSKVAYEVAKWGKYALFVKYSMALGSRLEIPHNISDLVPIGLITLGTGVGVFCISKIQSQVQSDALKDII